MFEIDIVLTHYLFKVLLHTQEWIRSLLFYLNSTYFLNSIQISCYNLPKKSKEYSVLKSSHVYSKFREVFKQDVYRVGVRVIIINNREDYLKILLNTLLKVSSFLSSEVRISYSIKSVV